jgi:hypothetical protein
MNRRALIQALLTVPVIGAPKRAWWFMRDNPRSQVVTIPHGELSVICCGIELPTTPWVDIASFGTEGFTITIEDRFLDGTVTKERARA